MANPRGQHEDISFLNQFKIKDVPDAVDPQDPCTLKQAQSLITGGGTTYPFTSSTTWIVVHNRGYYPNVTVWDSNGDLIIVSPHNDSVNQFTITHSVATAGQVRVS